ERNANGVVQMKVPKRKKLVLAGVAVAILGAVVGCYSLFLGRQPFDPVYMADIETNMWEAYYSKNKTKLALLLVRLLRRQFGMSTYEAATTGRLLADSAMIFKRSKPGHYNDALPPLIKAYSKIKGYSGMKFDPKEAAEADLAWWVYRRTPRKKDRKTVGEGITRLYETIYGYKHPGFVQAGQLRADAAHFRDIGRKKCDWKKINAILLESYQALKRAMDAKKPTPR
ncbi:MAG: hypothetical protein KAG97_11900, partial [Victivallales bacterium]|nr:hypothetical protein [Victivallales bacterium]